MCGSFRLGIIVFLFALCGCVDFHPAPAMPGDWSPQCVRSGHPTSVAQGGAFSLRIGEDDVWIFGETIVEDADGNLLFFSNVSAASDSSLPFCEGELDYTVDENGTVLEIIPLNTAEIESMEGDEPSPRVALWPLSGFVHEGEGWVFYRKAVVRDYFDLDEVGVGLARLLPGEVGERIVFDTDAEEPTLLWTGDDITWAVESVVDGDDLYLYGCAEDGWLSVTCRVARVPLDSFTDPSAYRYYTGDAWSEDEEEAAAVFAGGDRLSVSYNAHLEQYVAIYPRFFSNDVELQTSETPFGPFGDPQALFSANLPVEWFLSDVFHHPQFDEEDGKRVFISYYTSPLVGEKGMWAGSFTFE